jgi:hypothetical protein
VSECCYTAPALLELASTGEIQFVRSSANGGYEILSHEEAAQMMQQPGQTIEIVSNAHEVEVRDRYLCALCLFLNLRNIS